MALLDRLNDGSVFLLDACVLIDYRNSDMGVIKLVAEHMGEVVVIPDVIDEVPGLTEQELERYMIKIFEVEGDLAAKVEAVKRRTSLADSLCMVACREKNWTCVTNDQDLQMLCEQHGVQARFGLGLMLDLVAVGAMTKQQAKETARLIQESNLEFIHDKIIRDFERKVDAI